MGVNRIGKVYCLRYRSLVARYPLLLRRKLKLKTLEIFPAYGRGAPYLSLFLDSRKAAQARLLI